MDILGENPVFNLADHYWRIYARSPIMPPHYAGPNAEIVGSMITEGCEVYGTVKNSVLFAGVVVEEGASVIDAVVMPGTVIKAGASVTRAIVSEDCVIGENSVIGEADGAIALIGYSTNMPAGTHVAAGEQADNNTLKGAGAK